jgi:hypothetical protein
MSNNIALQKKSIRDSFENKQINIDQICFFNLKSVHLFASKGLTKTGEDRAFTSRN